MTFELGNFEETTDYSVSATGVISSAVLAAHWPSPPESNSTAFQSGDQATDIGMPFVRLFDIFSASSALLLALPVLIILSIALQLNSPGRLFFIHQRIGRNGRPFPCMKFRTMHENADAMLAKHLAENPDARKEWELDHKLRNDPRVSRMAAIVRKLSLDELPQLLNIIVGHMGVVGPRPIVAAEIPRYGSYFVHYCSVRPGLTGLWQISGRNNVSYDERVQLDCRYVEQKSLWFNLTIIARTIPAVMGARGAY